MALSLAESHFCCRRVRSPEKQPDGKGAVPFKRVPGVEVCAACHGLAIDKMTALYGKRDDCSTCHPYHARPMHGKVYENRQATTKTVLE